MTTDDLTTLNGDIARRGFPVERDVKERWFDGGHGTNHGTWRRGRRRHIRKSAVAIYGWPH